MIKQRIKHQIDWVKSFFDHRLKLRSRIFYGLNFGLDRFFPLICSFRPIVAFCINKVLSIEGDFSSRRFHFDALWFLSFDNIEKRYFLWSINYKVLLVSFKTDIDIIDLAVNGTVRIAVILFLRFGHHFFRRVGRRSDTIVAILKWSKNTATICTSKSV